MGLFLTLVAFVVTLGLTWRYLGSYMEAVFNGRVHWLSWLERPVYRAARHESPNKSRRGSATPARW